MTGIIIMLIFAIMGSYILGFSHGTEFKEKQIKQEEAKFKEYCERQKSNL